MPALPIGGFMPIPLAMMIPFMATQSIVMGDAFGKAYQFGKRKISAMSNDDFNSLTMSDLISQMQTEFKHAIPAVEESIRDSTKLQETIIREMLLILPRFATSVATDIVQDTQPAPSTSNNQFKQLIDALYNVGNTPSAFAEDLPEDKPELKIFIEGQPTGFESMTDLQVDTAFKEIQSGTWVLQNVGTNSIRLKSEFNKRHGQHHEEKVTQPSFYEGKSQIYIDFHKVYLELIARVLLFKTRYNNAKKQGNVRQAKSDRLKHNGAVSDYYRHLTRHRSSSDYQTKLFANQKYTSQSDGIRTI